MIRGCLLLTMWVGVAAGQSRMDLLERVAQHYATADSFEVKGRATAVVPGTSWKVGYPFDAKGIQPKMLPADLHATTMQDLGGTGMPLKPVRIDAHATDPMPAKTFSVEEPFGDYQRLTQRLLEAKLVGEETVAVAGASSSLRGGRRDF